MNNTKRNLDGIYFRVKRDGEFDNICFSDLTTSEMEKVMTSRSTEWYKEMCKILAQTLRSIGDEFDLVGEA